MNQIRFKLFNFALNNSLVIKIKKLDGTRYKIELQLKFNFFPKKN